MLRITIPAAEFFDESTYCFITTKETTLTLEHSLVSISKWESETEKPFIGRKLTRGETIQYIRCMTITQNVDPLVYESIPDRIIDDVSNYINQKQTATWFGEDESKKRPQRRVITSELIYYWMIKCGIPWECEKWHINRLLTLIRVCQEESKPSKQLSYKERAALNAARKKKFNTRG